MYTLMIILHMIGLAMGVGTGFAFMFLSMAIKDLSIEEKGKFMLRAFVLSKMGSIGLGLLILSGIGMLVMNGSGLVNMGGMWFHIKMTLLVIFIAIFGYQQMNIAKAKRANGGPVMAKIALTGKILLPVALMILISAVLAFH